MRDAIRVVLADDHSVIRSGVRVALEDREFEIVGEAVDADGAVTAALEHEPDICLIDLYMPGGGIAAARRIKSTLPSCVVIMLTVSESESDLLEALRAGADGYLLKTMAADRLPDALIGALSGEAALPRALAARIISEFRGPPGSRRTWPLGGVRSPLIGQLSPRELEVLELLFENLTTSAIAMRLGISDVTVRRHVSAIVRISGAHDRRGAIEIMRRELEVSDGSFAGDIADEDQ